MLKATGIVQTGRKRMNEIPDDAEVIEIESSDDEVRSFFSPNAYTSEFVEILVLYFRPLQVRYMQTPARLVEGAPNLPRRNELRLKRKQMTCLPSRKPVY